MATLSSAGIGSGLNVESIITGLMNIERQPVTRLQSQQSSLQSKISAMGTFKGALSSLQSHENLEACRKVSGCSPVHRDGKDHNITGQSADDADSNQFAPVLVA